MVGKVQKWEHGETLFEIKVGVDHEVQVWRRPYS